MSSARKILFWGLGGIAGAICVAMIFFTPLPNFVPLLFHYVVYQPLFPSTISWDDRSAWRKCESAMADPRQWPPTPYGTCAAMQMCYAEAPFSEAQQKALEDEMRKLPGCW